MSIELIFNTKRMVATLRELSLDELVAQLRKAGHVWFRNTDLLLLEELIRRAQQRQRS